MKITMCKTRPVKVGITVTKDDEGKEVVKDYTKQKYVCPSCNSLDIRIRRGGRNLADGQCKDCGNTWYMRFFQDNPAIHEESRKFLASKTLAYTYTYDRTAPYDDQLTADERKEYKV